MFALSERARRILIAVLAFALAAAFAIAASIAPAEAKDEKRYTATVDDDNPSTSVEVTFTNVSPTNTQDAGSFSVQFPDGFADLTGSNVSSPLGTTWQVLSDPGDSTVIISAQDGGHRIAEGQSVSVLVSWTDAPSGPQQLVTQGDQQAGGVFKGGNDFKLSGSDPIITVCAATQCVTTGTYNAEITCSDACLAAAAPAPQGEYELTVVFVDKSPTFSGLIIVELTTTDGKAPNPGHAEVLVDGVPIEQCGVSGSPPQTNCFHVNRAPPGKNLEYLVIWDLDPRFRFR